MATSTPAKASSPANISPVGPPPAIRTACFVLAIAFLDKKEARTQKANSSISPMYVKFCLAGVGFVALNGPDAQFT
jgi:hypothetical protein